MPENSEREKVSRYPKEPSCERITTLALSSTDFPYKAERDFKPIKGKRAEIIKKSECDLGPIFNSASIDTNIMTLRATVSSERYKTDDFYWFWP